MKANPVSKLSDLKAAKYNPREITDEALTGLGHSLSEFGDLSGITFNARTGNLVTGHQRTKSIQQKFGNLPITDNKIVTPDGHAYPVRFVDWPIEKEKAALVAANNPALQGSFTHDVIGLLDSIRVSLPEEYQLLNFDEIRSLPVNIAGLVDGQEFDESLVAGLGLNAYFKVTLPVGESDQFDKDLDRLLKKYPNAAKEKRI